MNEENKSIDNGTRDTVKDTVKDNLEKTANDVSNGEMKLMTPIVDGNRTVDSLKYNFNLLTGRDMARAIDRAGDKTDAFRISETQGLFLFAEACAKCDNGVDATDIRERLGIQDAIKAIQISQLFFLSASRAGDYRIMKS